MNFMRGQVIVYTYIKKTGIIVAFAVVFITGCGKNIESNNEMTTTNYTDYEIIVADCIYNGDRALNMENDWHIGWKYLKIDAKNIDSYARFEQFLDRTDRGEEDNIRISYDISELGRFSYEVGYDGDKYTVTVNDDTIYEYASCIKVEDFYGVSGYFLMNKKEAVEFAWQYGPASSIAVDNKDFWFLLPLEKAQSFR